MPKYISAYDLQQREGLSRLEILELAEKTSTYWKIHEAHVPFVEHEDPRARIDASKLTGDHLHWLAGFEWLKKTATDEWAFLAIHYRTALKELGHIPNTADFNEYENLDTWLCSHLPPSLTGRDAYLMFGDACPQEFQDNLDRNYTTHTVVSSTPDKENIIGLFIFLKMMDDVEIWTFIKHNEDHIFNLFFEVYFRNWLFFDDAQQQETAAPDATPQTELPPFEMTNRVSSGTQDKEQVKATCAENPIALSWIKSLRKTKTEAETAKWLLGADNPKRSHMAKKNNLTVISCLLRPDAPSPKHARNQIEGVLRKK